MDRITRELTGAQQVLDTAQMIYSRIEDTLGRVLALVSRCDEVYRLGGPQVRRLSNQFFRQAAHLGQRGRVTQSNRRCAPGALGHPPGRRLPASYGPKRLEPWTS